MSGNPHSITLMACLRSNPLFIRRLADLSHLLKSDQIKQVLKDEHVDTDVFNNENSLRIAHEVSLLKLRNTEEESYKFYFFLGLLPSGATV
jgi:hypothetical protein